MPAINYTGFEALDPYFALVQKGLRDFVDGDHYFDLFADDAVFESRYHFPGWPTMLRGRADLLAALSGYGKSIRVHAVDGLVVHPSRDGRTVVIEYDVHGTILRTGGAYENRLISVVTIENRKIVYWRDYMDSLSAWTALNPV
jgi:ketosteroid isomerase-like protein